MTTPIEHPVETQAPSDQQPPNAIARLRERPLVRWLEHWVPLGGFVGGFVFDSLTLGRRVEWYDLLLLSAYAVFGSMAMILISRRVFPKIQGLLVFSCQFAIGAMFSALVVLYFKSAGGLMPTLFVIGLFGGMVANEFLHKHERLRSLVWAIYAISVVMWLNFLLPHLLKSVKPAWFYVSTILACVAIVGTHTLAKLPRKSLRASAAAIAALVVMYMFGLVPPVPLVLEKGFVCTDFTKGSGEYACMADEQGAVARFLGLTPTVTRKAGAPVYALSAVSAPTDADVVVEHRWYQHTEDGWQARDTMQFTMKGGRKQGWRFWSRKRNIASGLWRVETALHGGGVVARQDMEIVEGEGPKQPKSL